MKKFNKCLFMVIAAISTLLFTVYKLRYDRLYHVMQVLEVFGTPVDHSCDKPAGQLDTQVPSWVNLEPGLYAYSGHCSSLPGEKGACPQVEVLALMQDSVNTDNMLCNLWIEGSMQPILGSFSHRVLQGAEDKLYSGVVLSCQSKFTTKVPFGVSFFRDDKTRSTSAVIPVSPVRNPEESSRSNSKAPGESSQSHLSSILVCIQPSPVTSILELVSMLEESLQFHAMLGVTDIVVYSNFLPHSVQKIVGKLRRSNIKVVVSPWNVPAATSSQVQQTLLLQDCYERSRLRSRSYTLLSPSQVLMPESGKNLTETLLMTAALKQGPNEIPVRRFCSEYPNDKKSSHLISPVTLLQSTYYNKHLSENTSRVLHVRESPPDQANQDQNTHRLFINEYGPCNSFDFDEKQKTAVYEAGALRFLTSFPAFISSIQQQ